MLYGKKGGHLLVMPPTLPTMASTILFVIDCPKSVIEQDGSAGPWSAIGRRKIMGWKKYGWVNGMEPAVLEPWCNQREAYERLGRE